MIQAGALLLQDLEVSFDTEEQTALSNQGAICASETWRLNHEHPLALWADVAMSERIPASFLRLQPAQEQLRPRILNIDSSQAEVHNLAMDLK